LFSLNDSTVLGICVHKLLRIGLRAIVATSDQATDDPIAEWCTKNGVEVYRGELENVALRTFSCLSNLFSDGFFRVNADSPFLQPDLLVKAIQIFEESPSVDLVTNVLERTFPYGIAVELIKTETFLENFKYFQGSETEHITSYFYKYSSLFNIKSIKFSRDISSYRFVLDTTEDWEYLKQLHSDHPNIFNYK
jgi:spore coat polysaccharide biosynthesis protein SpsF